jgi:hypothetical protein
MVIWDEDEEHEIWYNMLVDLSYNSVLDVESAIACLRERASVLSTDDILCILARVCDEKWKAGLDG